MMTVTALARKLYQEAGYSAARPLDVVLTYPSEGPEVRRFMEALAAMWQTNLGANVQIYNEEWKVFLQARALKQPLLFWDAWTGDYPDPYTFMQLNKTRIRVRIKWRLQQSHNLTFVAGSQARNTNDQATRYKLFHDAEAILNDRTQPDFCQHVLLRSRAPY